jgi:hypothetical protein
MVAAKSEMLKRMDQIQSELEPILKGLAFRVRGRNFNRRTSDELTQVIHLQMGWFDPPGTVYVPGLTRNYYGRFTIDIGVYVPEVAEYQHGTAAGSFVKDYSCCIRARLGQVGPDRKDLWWELDQASEITSEIWTRLERDGLPFLERFSTRDAILNDWMSSSDNFDFFHGDPSRIVCAIILVKRGQLAEARKLLSAQARETLNPGHPAYVRALAERLGVGQLDV